VIRFGENETQINNMLGDVIGEAVTSPYKQYAQWFSETVQIQMYAKEPRMGGIDDARMAIQTLETNVKEVIREDWPSILETNSAYVYRKNKMSSRNSSFMLQNQRFLARTMILLLAVKETWNLVPDTDLAPEAETYTLQTTT